MRLRSVMISASGLQVPAFVSGVYVMACGRERNPEFLLTVDAGDVTGLSRMLCNKKDLKKKNMEYNTIRVAKMSGSRLLWCFDLVNMVLVLVINHWSVLNRV